MALNADGWCRLCWRQAASQRTGRRSIGVVEANADGQQLFLANLFRQKRLPPQTPSTETMPNAGRYPVIHRQGVLVDLVRDILAGQQAGFPDPPIPELALLLEQAAAEHAARHGWSKTRRNSATAALRILLALQDTPGAPITTTEIARLTALSANARPLEEILDAVGMLDDDKESTLDAWFARQSRDLPEPMAGELRTWFEILRDGRTTPPRFRPKSTNTIRVRTRALIPVLKSWEADGHRSLRTITRNHVQDALPTSGSRRALTGSALRSLFRVLKARKVVFVNPTVRIRTGKPETRQPLPMSLAVVREALGSPNPARQALAALVAFHAPRSGDIRALRLTDVRDGRMYLPTHTILLADEARNLVGRWLDHRATHWPRTLNPHLFINTFTAVRTVPVSHVWINKTLGVSAQAVREDRILHEAAATFGDPRRLCDLFGLSILAARRYTDTVNGPTLGSATQAPR
ncbi:hypothetical protein B4N89_46110 [Embleya scabrispora]|uniref:Core-binding (CB) domain-containing protein n=1 Tax=Embleya scabrispora TaxID=159449 RepID=A0A1T3NJF8_9ACTN|nr:hypothetical protein [Embleya scabrispora]OPC76850.1 hypothetical protein B4N89_46110 [Embleya scabrispora]